MDKIPCRNFDLGDGVCQFGSSCFYAHVYRDGTRESIEVRPGAAAHVILHIADPGFLSAMASHDVESSICLALDGGPQVDRRRGKPQHPRAGAPLRFPRHQQRAAGVPQHVDL